jgi:hypothetical protein
MTSRAAAAAAVWVAALAHEAIDDAVKNHAVVIMLSGKVHKVVDGSWRSDWVECNNQRAHRSFHRCGVSLGRIDAHFGSFSKFLLFWSRAIEWRK